MADLSTTYMGLQLNNPIIISSSGLTDTAEKAADLEKHGAAAVVLKSIFEEQILMEVDKQRVNNMYGAFSETENYLQYFTRKHELDNYLSLIKESKAKLSIPVIASINCVTASEWTDLSVKIQEAGADALELNAFILPSDPEYAGEEIETLYYTIIERVKEKVTIPVALKISHYFSGMAHFLTGLSETGIDALVLFNRFFNPDIDLDTLRITSSHIYSTPEENAMVLRWVGILSGKVSCDIAATTGIHDGKTILKNILAGARAVEISSVVYKQGPQVIKAMLKEMDTWLESKNFKTLPEIIGKLKQSELVKPMIYERAQFMKYFTDAR